MQKLLTATAAGLITLSALTGLASTARAENIAVGEVRVEDQWKCTVTSGENTYYATANTELEAQNKLTEAGHGTDFVCAIQETNSGN